jgi:hypothetical protein
MQPNVIVSTPSGILITACNYVLHSIDPFTGKYEPIAGAWRQPPLPGTGFGYCQGLVLVEREQCVYVCDKKSILRVKLHPKLFVPKTEHQKYYFEK